MLKINFDFDLMPPSTKNSYNYEPVAEKETFYIEFYNQPSQMAR